MSNPRIALDRQQVLRLLDGHPVQVSTEVGLLEFEAIHQQPWQPLTKIPLRPRVREFYVKAMGAEAADNIEVWANDDYEVIVRRMVSDDGPARDGWHLSIKRRDRQPIRNWRHFQQMKNEICGEECEGFELFPRESRLADNANQYHVYVLPEGTDVPAGFPAGFVIVNDEDVAELNASPDPGRQEPMQPGLGVGRTMQAAAEHQGLGPAREAVLRHARSLVDD